MVGIERGETVVFADERPMIDRYGYASAGLGVQVCILQQVADECRGEGWIHADDKILLRKIALADNPVRGVDLVEDFDLLVDHCCEVDVAVLGELAVVDLGEQEQCLVHFDDPVEGMMHFYQVVQLLTGWIGAVDQPVDTVSKYGQRCLQFVRGIADELFLLFEKVLRTVDRLLCGLVELPEFGDRGIVWNFCMLEARGGPVEPLEQGIQRTHAAVEHPYRDAENNEKQQEI